MTRKALPSVLLHKSEVTYRDTGVFKNIQKDDFKLRRHIKIQKKIF